MLSTSVNEHIDQHGVNDAAYVFHSFRNNFEDAATAAELAEDVRRALMGLESAIERHNHIKSRCSLSTPRNYLSGSDRCPPQNWDSASNACVPRVTQEARTSTASRRQAYSRTLRSEHQGRSGRRISLPTPGILRYPRGPLARAPSSSCAHKPPPVPQQ